MQRYLSGSHINIKQKSPYQVDAYHFNILYP